MERQICFVVLGLAFVGGEADKELEIDGPESVLRLPIMGLPRISR